MTTEPRGHQLFIVDNSVSGWTGQRYLEEWTAIARAFDIATGYFEIGSLLALDGKWQGLEKIRFLMGAEVTQRTRRALLDAVRERATAELDSSIEAEKKPNPFLRGVPAILDALKSGQIECRVYDRAKFHAKAYITHAKLEVVGSQALVGSSNFTGPGLTQNIELNVHVLRRDRSRDHVGQSPRDRNAAAERRVVDAELRHLGLEDRHAALRQSHRARVASGMLRGEHEPADAVQDARGEAQPTPTFERGLGGAGRLGQQRDSEGVSPQRVKVDLRPVERTRRRVVQQRREDDRAAVLDSEADERVRDTVHRVDRRGERGVRGAEECRGQRGVGLRDRGHLGKRHLRLQQQRQRVGARSGQGGDGIRRLTHHRRPPGRIEENAVP